ncbi:MAG TPA: hypothetical protein VFS05_03335 [Gemmatimonadaceae bacterium]|nr:hypothetical protein [Gemmatimonadaceae bacterium]
MHVIAHHHITDSVAFRARTAEPAPGRPAHWRLIAAAPTRDGSACFSLWWADSAEALQRVLAAAMGPAGSVECHEVDDDDALGLPTTPISVIRLVAVDRAARDGAERRTRRPARPIIDSPETPRRGS